MPDGLKIDLYCLCWNDARMLPHFFKHYDPIVDRYFVLDNGSTDESIYILENHGRVAVDHFDVHGKSFVAKERRLGDTMWRKSDADWVIVTDIDEFTYHPRMIDYLRRCKEQKITAIRTIGYDMVSDCFPSASQPLFELVTRGRRSIAQDRLCIFNPRALKATNYGPGRHAARPKGRVIWPHYPEVLLLHYKQLGLDYAIGRSAELRLGLRPRDLEFGWGAHYTWSPAETIASWQEVNNASRPVPGLGTLKHVEPASYYDERYIQRSGLVDEDWYLANYPDAKAAGYDALTHFCTHGWKEDRKPNFYFDPVWFCARYPALHTDGRNPLYEYVVHGEREGAWPSPLFNAGWYRAQHGLSADESPLRHYIQRRNAGLVSPVPDFDAVEYCRKHPEIIAAGRDPFEHYWRRQTSDVEAQVQDENTKAASSLRVWKTWRLYSARNPYRTGANGWPAKDASGATESGAPKQVRLSNRSDKRLVRLSGLLDAEWYLATYPGAKSDDFDALSDYCSRGWKEGRRPNFYFDPDWYSENYPALLEGDDRNPLCSYVLRGEKQGAWPSPLFDTNWYRDQHGLSVDESPLRHYLQRRKSGLVSPIPGFDAVEYCQSHPEITATGDDPFEAHCKQQGIETEMPEPDEHFPDLATSQTRIWNGNLLIERLHRFVDQRAPRFLRACRTILNAFTVAFLRFSAFAWNATQRTSARYGFDEVAYLEAYPEIAKAIRAGEWASALHHYRVRGAYESRLADKRYIRAAIGCTAAYPPGVADLQNGAPEGFDELAYIKAFPDVAAAIRAGSWTSALHHYRVHGAGEDRLSDGRYLWQASRRNATLHPASTATQDDAPEGFDGAAYVKAFPDVAAAMESGEWASALHHYRIHGARENRLADERYIFATAGCAATSLSNPGGVHEVAPDTFDESNYLAAFEDVAAAVKSGEWISALHHYRIHGALENRLADERYIRAIRGLSADIKEVAPDGFDEAAYLRAFPDVAAAVQSGKWASGLRHYLVRGALENRLANPHYIRAANGFTEPSTPVFPVDIEEVAPDAFDEGAYIKAYPEIVAAIKSARGKTAWPPASGISELPPILPRPSVPAAPSPSR